MRLCRGKRHGSVGGAGAAWLADVLDVVAVGRVALKTPSALGFKSMAGSEGWHKINYEGSTSGLIILDAATGAAFGALIAFPIGRILPKSSGQQSVI